MANYSNVDFTQCAEFLSKHYYLKLKELKSLSGGAANSSFHATTETGDFVVTILDNHNEDSALKLAELLDYLQQQSVPIDGLILNAEGKPVSHLLGIPTIVRPYISGLPFSGGEKVLHNVGKLLGQIHEVSCPSFIQSGGRRLPTDWREKIQPAPKDLLEMLETAEKLIDTDEWNHTRKTLCHGDLFPDNLILLEEKNLIAIDWETASYDSSILDLGITVVAFWDDVESMGFDKVVSILFEGYALKTNLSEDDARLIKAATFYAFAMLAFHRYHRHCVKYPNEEKALLYKELIEKSRNLPEFFRDYSET